MYEGTGLQGLMTLRPSASTYFQRPRLQLALRLNRTLCGTRPHEFAAVNARVSLDTLNILGTTISPLRMLCILVRRSPTKLFTSNSLCPLESKPLDLHAAQISFMLASQISYQISHTVICHMLKSTTQHVIHFDLNKNATYFDNGGNFPCLW